MEPPHSDPCNEDPHGPGPADSDGKCIYCRARVAENKNADEFDMTFEDFGQKFDSFSRDIMSHFDNMQRILSDTNKTASKMNTKAEWILKAMREKAEDSE